MNEELKKNPCVVEGDSVAEGGVGERRLGATNAAEEGLCVLALLHLQRVPSRRCVASVKPLGLVDLHRIAAKHPLSATQGPTLFQRLTGQSRLPAVPFTVRDHQPTMKSPRRKNSTT